MSPSVLRASSIALVAGLAACGRDARPPTSPPEVRIEAEPPAPPAASEQTAPARPSDAPRPCEPGSAWDTKAAACRLVPGGGHGWAGCSQATRPQNGAACFSGTRWESCDCVCDAAATAWNPATLSCAKRP